MIRESFVIETKTLYLRHFALLASRWRTFTLQRVCQRKRISF